MALPLGKKRRKKCWQTLALDAALTFFLISFAFYSWFFFSLVAGVFLMCWSCIMGYRLPNGSAVPGE